MLLAFSQACFSLRAFEQHGFAMNLGDIGIAFGMARDADALHAIFLEHAGLSNWMAASYLPMGVRRAAAQHQHLRHAGLARQSGNALLQIRLVQNEAGRHMGNGFEARLCARRSPPSSWPAASAGSIRAMKTGRSLGQALLQQR